MTFISFRRELLDQKLFSHPLLISHTEGNILDVGGVKKRRGKFQIPAHLQSQWKTLNNNTDTHPDILCQLPDIKCDDQSCSQIIMTEVIEYIDRPEILIKECHRVLKAGGIMTISFPFLSPLHGDKEQDYLRITASYFEKLIKEKFQIIDKSSMGGPLLLYYDAVKGEWLTHGKNTWWQKIYWKKIAFFKHFLIFIDRLMFPDAWAATTGYWYVLKKI